MDERDFPLSDHLTELRKRLLICLIPMGILLIPAVWASRFLLRWLMAPLAGLGLPLYLYHVTDSLMLRLRLGLVLDVTAIAPLAAFELGRFLWPGLLPKERKVLTVLSFTGGVLFSAGVLGFFFGLAPWVTGLWFEQQTVQSMISAGSCTGLWLVGALVSGLVAALLPLGSIGLSLLHHRKENKKP